MENNLTTAALDALRLGLSVIPCSANKRPALERWKPYQSAPMNEAEALRHFPGAPFLGLVCGKVSGGLEVLDVDLKYDTTGTLWDELQEAIDAHLPGLLERLVITETMSAGLSLIHISEPTRPY